MQSLLESAAAQVQSELGGGYTEDNYQKALAWQLKLDGAHTTMEESRPCYYKNKYIGQCRADIVVDFKGEKACVELKQAASEASDAVLRRWCAQARKYSMWFEGHDAYLVVFAAQSSVQRVSCS